jgi:hypothetical protein
MAAFGAVFQQPANDPCTRSPGLYPAGGISFLLSAMIEQGVEKRESGSQARRAAIRQAQHVQAHVSIGESRATLNDGLRRSFSTAC